MTRRRSVWVHSCLLILPIAFAPEFARADLVYFKEGGEAQIPAEIDGEVVRLISPAGTFEFRKDDFRSIIPGHWPDQEWPTRREQAEAGDAQARFRAAWWALEHGMTDEAVSMLRSVQQASPPLEMTDRLVTLLDRLEQPAKTPDVSVLRIGLRGEFSISESPRIALLHQHDSAEATDRLDLIDRVLKTFYLSYAALGFELSIPDEKLVAVWFANEADYRAYLRKEAGASFLTTRGYYHPTRRVVFVYDGRSRPDFQRSAKGLRERLDELDEASQNLANVPPTARYRLSIPGNRPQDLSREDAEQVIDRLRRETNRTILLQELERLQGDQGAAVHETIHQLVIASGLAPRYESLPIWLHEGLAMQFEAFRGGRWAGLSDLPTHRLDQWRRLRSLPSIESLLQDEGLGNGYAPVPYAMSWALVYYLRTQRPEEFVAFLDQLRNPHPGSIERVVPAFRSIFGNDLNAFRKEWIESMRSVQTPLEANLPSRSTRRPNQ